MISGSDTEQIVEGALKRAAILALIVVVSAIILTAVITKTIVGSSIKTTEEAKQDADRHQVIEQLTPHQKKVLGL